MKGNPKYIFFTDFDGTITLKDSEYMTNWPYKAILIDPRQ